MPATTSGKTLYRLDDAEPYRYVAVEPKGDHLLPDVERGRVFVHTVHDGDTIPRDFFFGRNGSPRVPVEDLEPLFVRERDWGANLIASEVAAALGTGGYGRCEVARMLLDFNRFPGSTPPGSLDSGLDRLAIYEPFSTALDHAEKIRLLEETYDNISATIERQLTGKLIMLAIHTYDERNSSQTQRPALSILSSMAGYQRNSRMPHGVFDPMFPDVLGETTCSPILRDRISLNLERNGFRVSHNHPYPLPEGSMEVRAQVWFFFNFLRERFEDRFADSRDDNGYQLVWQMLLNTNHRTHAAELLKSYLHGLRRIPDSSRKALERAREAYEHIHDFLHRANIVAEFRASKARPSSLGIEVRKDLLCTFDEAGRPKGMTAAQRETAALIGSVIGGALTTFFETDRQFL